MRTLIVSVPLVAFAWLVSPPAVAQEAAAEALFDGGREAMAAGDFVRACQRFRESRRLDPAAGTDLNLADCEERRGRFATAWQLFRAVEQRLPATDDRLAVARDRGRQLEGRVPKLTLHLAADAPRDATVREGDVALGAASFDIPLPMDPGLHELVVSAPGFEPRSFRVELVEAEKEFLEVRPGPPSSAAPPSRTGASAESSPRSRSQGGSSTRPLGFVLGGIGVAGLGVGAVAGLMAVSKKKTVDASCDERKQCSQEGVDAAGAGHTLEIASNVGWIVGVLGLGAGAYFVLSSSAGSTQTTASVGPIPAGARLTVERSW